MATRLYYAATLTPPVSPAYYAANKTSDAIRSFCSPIKQNTSMATKASSEASATTPYTFLTEQFVSDPLAAQTISGTVKGQIRCQESNAAADFCAGIVIRVCSYDGSTFRGTLLEYLPGSLTSEYDAAGLINRYYPPSTALGALDIQAGDRLVIDVLTKSFNSVITSYTANHRFGDSAALDLPEDETDTNDYNPWIEFSTDLTFIDRQKISQTLSQIETQAPGRIKASQTLSQIETQAPGRIKTYQIIAQVEYIPGTSKGTLFFCHG